MNVVLLSGGSGRRLWPLSNDICGKQFIKIFKAEDGTHESMLQRVYRQIKKVEVNASITVAAGKAQISAIRNQLGENVSISVEPCRRDTFPAIALAAAYLADVAEIEREASVIFCPVDIWVEDDYFTALKELSDLADQGEAKLVLMGIEPSCPSDKYGYMIPATAEKTAAVRCFKEKPDAEAAAEYIRQGALWNGGVFACKLNYVLKKAQELLGFSGYHELYEKYEMLEKISFDYAVVEKEKKIQVMRFAGRWQDIGTWNTLTEAMEENYVGNVITGDFCENVHIINELNLPVLAVGVHDVVITASPEGILVSDKEQSLYIKPFVDRFERPVMFAEKSWGDYHVLDVEENSRIIKVTLNAGHRMTYHSHRNRDEIWGIISGEGQIIIDDTERAVNAGDAITMKAGCRHTIIAESELKLVEIQLGKDISVHDKEKYTYERMGLFLNDLPEKGENGRRADEGTGDRGGREART